jgi:hypothetical protein
VTRLSEGFFSMQFWSLLNNGCLRKAKAMPESAATKASMKCSPRNLAGLLEFAIGRDRPTDRSSLASALGDPGLKEPAGRLLCVGVGRTEARTKSPHYGCPEGLS